jgi:acetyl esterase/lipase
MVVSVNYRLAPETPAARQSTAMLIGTLRRLSARSGS